MSDKKEKSTLFERFTSWQIRFRRRSHLQTFLATLSEVELFKLLIKSQPCPGCGQKEHSLELQKFVRNPKGWDAEVSCGNCNFHGIINSEGFDFKQISSKGKARE